MLKQTKRQVNELCFPPYDLLPCLFPQFAFYFLSNFDITLTTSRMMRSASKRRLKFTAFDRRSCQVHENDTPKNRNASIMTPHSSQTNQFKTTDAKAVFKASEEITNMNFST